MFIGIVGFGYFMGMTVFDNSIVNVDAESLSFEKAGFDSEHVEIFNDYPKEYEKNIMEFIK